ncbi:Hypothetical predicted protein, partial [Olea europaea subsp. europaea]
MSDKEDEPPVKKVGLRQLQRKARQESESVFHNVHSCGDWLNEFAEGNKVDESSSSCHGEPFDLSEQCVESDELAHEELNNSHERSTHPDFILAPA